ncbi:hypothetical protein GW17_00010263 [Ensete ventricosum]|nr:hypothetical protein GW17_00010263 [Ensete ventricosum]RZR99025.1 hypothetical protein BHM03_00028503 [Ensete ventricosum]
MTRVYPNTGAPCADLPSLPACRYATREDGAAVLTVWRKSLLFSCNGFTVFDAEGNLVFRVDIYGSRSAGELVLMDASGKPLLTVRRKVRTLQKLSLGETWLVYNGEDADNPLYSVKRPASLLHCKGLAHVTPLRSGSAGYEVEGSYSRRICTVYDEQRRAVAEIQRKQTVGGVAFGDDVFRLLVQSDLNMSLAMAIVIVLDQMFR